MWIYTKQLFLHPRRTRIRVGRYLLDIDADGSLLSEVPKGVEALLHRDSAWRFVPMQVAEVVEVEVKEAVSSKPIDTASPSTDKKKPARKRGRPPKSND